MRYKSVKRYQTEFDRQAPGSSALVLLSNNWMACVKASTLPAGAESWGRVSAPWREGEGRGYQDTEEPGQAAEAS